MEYFLGSLITLVTIFIVRRLVKKENSNHTKILKHSQSRTLQLTAEIMFNFFSNNKPKPTQLSRYRQQTEVRIAFVDNQAYWIKDNCFYTAPVINDEIDVEAATQVDTMSMDKIQLDKMLYIVEQLREGLEDDRWNSGN